MDIVKIEDIQGLIINLRDQKVILDSDVAKIFGVGTKEINRAVKNNLDKFPEGYIIELSKNELDDLRSKFSSTKLSKTRTLPKAFTEKGLYMLATINLRHAKACTTYEEMKIKQAVFPGIHQLKTFVPLPARHSSA